MLRKNSVILLLLKFIFTLKSYAIVKYVNIFFSKVTAQLIKSLAFVIKTESKLKFAKPPLGMNSMHKYLFINASEL